jgi:hypothetical protein
MQGLKCELGHLCVRGCVDGLRSLKSQPALPWSLSRTRTESALISQVWQGEVTHSVLRLWLSLSESLAMRGRQ